MKKIIFTLVLIIGASCAYSQNIPEESVPSPVKDNLYANYKANNVTWELENEVYEAEYLENGMEKSIHLNATGDIIAVETHIDPHNLPEGSLTYINDNYPGSSINEAEYIEIHSGNFYGVELTHNGTNIELLFDERGNFMQRNDPDDNGENED